MEVLTSCMRAGCFTLGLFVLFFQPREALGDLTGVNGSATVNWIVGGTGLVNPVGNSVILANSSQDIMGIALHAPWFH